MQKTINFDQFNANVSRVLPMTYFNRNRAQSTLNGLFLKQTCVDKADDNSMAGFIRF